MNESTAPHSGAPIHPVAVVSVLALDLLSTAGDVFVLPVQMVITAIIAYIVVLQMQKFVAHDTFGAASAKACAMAVIAAIPTPVLGSVVGIILLSWAGISYIDSRRLLGRK